MSVEANVESNETKSIKGKVITIPEVDTTLTKEGYSADAKSTGDRLNALAEQYGNVTTPDAQLVGYDNESSGLDAVNVQSAIDEIVESDFKKTGGTVNGSVSVRTADNGHGTVMKNHSATDDYGTVLEDATKGGKTAKVSVSAALNLLTFTDNTSNIRDIHHEGNKPFGSYTGNGDATERTIETKGIGRLALVYNTDNLSFVTPQGALSIDTSAGTIEWIGSTKVRFLNGVLYVATTSEAFNIADKEYYYQVI